MSLALTGIIIIVILVIIAIILLYIFTIGMRRKKAKPIVDESDYDKGWD